MSTRTLSVVFTDIKGFTARTSTSSRAALRALLDRHESLLLPVIERYDGQVIKTIGDAFLLTFESPTNAVLCGLMIQETLLEANASAADDERIEVRVAINTGEVEVRGNDVFGETVNIAARIEGITEAGEVYFTHATYLSMNKSEVPTSEVGERRLKGIEEPIRVYRVIRDENVDAYRSLIDTQRAHAASMPAPPLAAPPPVEGRRRGWMPIIAAVLVLGGLAAAFGPDLYAHYAARAELESITASIEAAATRDEQDAAFERLNDLVDTYPEDRSLHLEVALVNGEHPYWRRFAFDQMAALLEQDPVHAEDPRIEAVMRQALGYLDLEETASDSRDERLRRSLARHFGARWKDELRAMLIDPDAERIDRRNAFLVLEHADALDPLLQFRYAARELWAPVRSNDVWNARVFGVLEGVLERDGAAPQGFELDTVSLPRHFTYFNEETDRAVRIVAGLFAERLGDVLRGAIDSDETGPRIHAQQVLAARDWLTPELERRYQRANLHDYWSGYTSPWVVDAARYFEKQEPASVAAKERAQLRKIAKETAEIIDSGSVPDARQDMSDYVERLDAVEAALAALGETG